MLMGFEEFRQKCLKGSFDYDLNHKKYAEYFRDNAKVGDGVTVNLWSDRHAYTIIKRTPKSLTLRRCKATLAPEFKPEFVPGGFCAHCTNQDDQEYIYEEDENGQIEKAYWSERKHGFYVGGCMSVSAGRHEFYDYNM